MTLEQLNQLSEDDAQQVFLRCCGSVNWASRMADQRPYASSKSLFEAGETGADALRREDWLEAFAAHPRIGDIGALRRKFADTRAWAEGEQAGTARASETTLQALAEGNRTYEKRYGYIFIVCATGKSAKEMLSLLQARLDNDPTTEFQIAAGEQRKITRLRLEKLLTAQT